MAISATDASDRVEQLIVLTERLTELIAEDALAFEQRRPRDATRTGSSRGCRPVTTTTT